MSKLFFAAIISSLAFIGCAHQHSVVAPEEKPVAPVIQEKPAPVSVESGGDSIADWTEHSVGVWKVSLPPDFSQMEEMGGMDATFRSESFMMLVSMGVDDTAEHMSVDEYAAAFITGMQSNGADILGLRGANDADVKIGGMETDVVIMSIGEETHVLHFIAGDESNKMYNFACGGKSSKNEKSKIQFMTCLAIEKTIKITK